VQRTNRPPCRRRSSRTLGVARGAGAQGGWGLLTVALVGVLLTVGAVNGLAASRAHSNFPGVSQSLGPLPRPPLGPSVSALKVIVLANPSSLDLGSRVTLTADATGGTPWYKYDWTALPVGCSNLNSSSLNCAPSEKGTFSVSVTVTDSTGAFKTASTTVVVNQPSNNPLLGFNTFTLYVFAVGLGVAAAVATTLVILVVRRRPPPGGARVVDVSKNPYIPPGSQGKPPDEL
jgi:PKD domain